MNCQFCSGLCKKNGRQITGVQRYKCKFCGKNQQKNYKYNACLVSVKEGALELLCKGCCIRGTSGFLGISQQTILRWLLPFSDVKPCRVFLPNDEYEIDEMYTYIGNKKNECWIMYAISRTTGQVIDLIVGRRTKENLKQIVDKVLLLGARRIITDNLSLFKTLVPSHLHRHGRRLNQKIERYNLNIRKDLSRLARRTICYSKKQTYLEAHLRLYFWG